MSFRIPRPASRRGLLRALGVGLALGLTSPAQALDCGPRQSPVVARPAAALAAPLAAPLAAKPAARPHRVKRAHRAKTVHRAHHRRRAAQVAHLKPPIVATPPAMVAPVAERACPPAGTAAPPVIAGLLRGPERAMSAIPVQGVDAATLAADDADAVKALATLPSNPLTVRAPPLAGPLPWPGYLPIAGAGAVPEPSTWALMLGGFGLAGLALRRAARGARVTIVESSQERPCPPPPTAPASRT